MDKTKLTIKDLGFNEFFESNYKVLKNENDAIARVVAEYKGIYRVLSDNGEYFAKITGKQIYIATKREDYPAVGDFVLITTLNSNEAIIKDILPRISILKKKYSNKSEEQIIATNIDTAFIVESVDKDINLNRFERFLVLVQDANIIPVFILNKIDLITETDINNLLEKIKIRFKDIKVILTSAKEDAGIMELINQIQLGKTYCFLGSSGVGKSTLINKLLGENKIKTQEINIRRERGKHTTTTRELYILKSGGIVIDNPGTREVGISDSNNGINDVFNEIYEISKNCKFSNCTHSSEPNCAILSAINNNKLDKSKFENYLKLKKESEYFELNNQDKRAKDRKFEKLIKKYLDNLDRN